MSLDTFISLNIFVEQFKLEVFVEGEEIILYNDMFDCIEKINYYTENEEERERIAHSGMMRVLHNYTQVQVVDKLIEKFKNNK